MKKSKQIHPFRRVRRAGVPLVSYETGDPWATVANCQRSLNGKTDETPLVQWDCLRGLQALNEAGAQWLASKVQDPAGMQDPATMLATLATHEAGPSGKPVPIVAPNTIIFAHNAQRFLDDVRVIQGVCNVRNIFKGIGATLVLLGPSFTLPAELKDDVIRIEELSPSEEDISRVIDSTVDDVKKSVPEFPVPEDKSRVSDTLLGYRSEFGVEQSLALSVTSEGIDTEKLWNLKVDALRQTAGLEVTIGHAGFEALAGCHGVKHAFRIALAGRERYRAVLWLDEIEKMVAGGGGGDLSGVTQALVEQFLFWTEAKRVKGCLLLGVPGAGKSATCKAVAGEAKVPLLRASMSTVKGNLVGQSEQQMKALLRAVDAVSQGNVLMLATCNSVDALTPELMARFKLFQFFYDFPDAEERAAIWNMYQQKFERTGDEVPASDNWVGREIESCCERAYMFNCTLSEAAKTVVPVAVSNRTKLDALRQSVSGRFLSAAHPGPFEYKEARASFFTPETSGRKLRVD